MTQNASKSIYTWTRKHLEFTLKYHLGKVAEELWQWLQLLPRTNGKIEFSLKEFIDFTKKKRGKPRVLHWVKGQFEKLIFLRIINIDKDFGHNTYRINLRHPDDIKPKTRKERNLHYHHVSVEKSASNDCQSETPFNSSSNSSIGESCTDSLEVEQGNKSDKEPVSKQNVDVKDSQRKLRIIQLCAKFGILFNPNKPTTDEIYKYAIEDIQQSLELFQQRNQTSPIKNPQGWLIDCLRYEFYLDSLYSLDHFLADISDWMINLQNNSE
jgi:hypothetical protein